MTILDEKNRGYAIGAADYMVKPVDRDRLNASCAGSVGTGGGRVLVVDDDDIDATRSCAGPRKRRMDSERSGRTARLALERLSEAVPDIIVLDLVMPVMDGFEFLDALRKRAEWRDLPVRGRNS